MAHSQFWASPFEVCLNNHLKGTYLMLLEISLNGSKFWMLYYFIFLRVSHFSFSDFISILFSGQISDQDLTVKPNGHRLLTRMASYPKCHPENDPHRYVLKPHEAITDLKVHTYFDFETI